MSSFKVNNTQINCVYWLENNKLNMEITLINLNPEVTIKTGNNTIEIPEVTVHPILNYQKAILSKTVK